jgi:hypothetical protein
MASGALLTIAPALIAAGILTVYYVMTLFGYSSSK